MTDKQIIIDGVPVQDCCYFDYENDGYEDSCYIHQNECSAQNCYYKQLKRKEVRMNDKQKIKLKPKEDLNEKIIKEKGNTKCIFYTDDICRNGDKTRDCVNCARVNYHSLYSLNWDNQERLLKIIKQKEQECEELKAEVKKQKEIAKEYEQRWLNSYGV